jgi:hypothetical protein
MDGGCLSSTGRIIIVRGELKCLERNLYQCKLMPHTSLVEDTEAKHELNLGLCDVKLEKKCLSLWLGQTRKGAYVMAEELVPAM